MVENKIYKCSSSSEDEDVKSKEKEKKKLNISKRRSNIKTNDKVLRCLTTKDNENLSSDGISGKISVLLIFPLTILIFLLVMIYV